MYQTFKIGRKRNAQKLDNTIRGNMIPLNQSICTNKTTKEGRSTIHSQTYVEKLIYM